MQRRATAVGIAGLCVGMVLVGIAYASTIIAGTPADWAPWLLAIGASASSVALFVLGAATRGANGRGTGWVLGALFAVLSCAFCVALAVGAPTGPEAIALGLPRRLAIVFYGVGFIPLFVLPVVFARTFGRSDRP